MDDARLKLSLKTLRWSTLTLADALHCPISVVMSWYYGHDPVPVAVAEWLERLESAHADNPPPVGGLQHGPAEKD